MLPQHPRSIAAVVSVVELGTFLEGIGRFPESYVPIAEQPSLPGERAADVRDEITSGRQQVEDLLGKHKESAIFPDRQLGNRVISLTSPASLTSTQWNDDCGGTTIIEAAAPDLWKLSMMWSIGASVSTSA